MSDEGGGEGGKGLLGGGAAIREALVGAAFVDEGEEIGGGGWGWEVDEEREKEWEKGEGFGNAHLGFVSLSNISLSLSLSLKKLLVVYLFDED